MNAFLRLLFAGGVALAAGSVVANAQSDGQKGVLELVSGERIAGRLDASAAEAGFAWASTVFRTPLVFDASSLSQATFDPDPATHAAAGEFQVTLTNGDVVFGDLAGLDAEVVSLATARHGNLVIPRRALDSLRRRAGGRIVHHGPNSVLEWQQRRTPPATAWRAVATSLVVAQAGAEIFRDGVFADDCEVECVMSWTGSPGFRIVLGAAADAAHDGDAVVIEVWDDLLVAFRERPDGVDLLQLPAVVKDKGSVRLRFSIAAGSACFVGEKGGEPRRFPLPAGNGIAIQQPHDGELRLDRLRIERPAAGVPALRSLAAADVRGYTAATAALQVGEGAVPLAAVDAIQFAPTAPAGAGDPAAAEATTGTELLLQDGTRLCGDFEGIAEGRLRLRTPWASQPVATAIDALKTIRVLGNMRPRQREQWKLAIKDDRFLGRIVAWSPADGTLQWQPTLGKSAAVLQTREDLRFDLTATSAYFVPRRDYPHRILFTNHDCVACKVVAITPATITMLEPFQGNRREVSAADVKALEFDPRGIERIAEDARIEPPTQDQLSRRHWLAEARKQRERNFIDAGRRDTILALPRKFKGSPPTHLVIAANGDVLRGILTSATDEAIHFEMSLTSDASVPRDRLVAMVLFPAAKPGDPVAATAGEKDLVLEIALDKETRVTLVVKAVTEKSITGVSPFLGEITIPCEDVVSLVSGSLRGKATGFFTAWNLTPMKEPPY